MKPWIKAIAASATVVGLVYGCNKDDNNFWDWMIPETEDTTTAAQINGYVFYPALVPASAENVQQLKPRCTLKVNRHLYPANIGYFLVDDYR